MDSPDQSARTKKPTTTPTTASTSERGRVARAKSADWNRAASTVIPTSVPMGALAAVIPEGRSSSTRLASTSGPGDAPASGRPRRSARNGPARNTAANAA